MPIALPFIVPFDPPEGFPDNDQLDQEEQAAVEDAGNERWAAEEDADFMEGADG